MTTVETKFGYANVLTEDDHVRIDYVEVNPEHRGQGHATEIMELAIAEARRQKADSDLPIYIVAHEYDAEVIELADLVSFYEKWFTIEDTSGDNVIMVL